MSILNIYSPNNKYKNIKCKAYSPTYTDGKLDHVSTDIIFYADIKDDFNTVIEKQGNRRIEKTEGTIITNSLRRDEVNVDWYVEIEGNKYIVNSIGIKENIVQKGMLKRPELITVLYLRK